MWRFWARGFGPRTWWYWMRTEGFPLWVVRHLPPRIVYWAFIRVIAVNGDGPGPEFDRAAKYWAERHGI